MMEAAKGRVNYFDTAPAYFGLKSETVFWKPVFKSCGESSFPATGPPRPSPPPKLTSYLFVVESAVDQI
jgi:hypothetical protein